MDFAADLFKAADKMRGGLEPSEYKHVALGLIFIKYISEAFQAMHDNLSENDFADPEDPEEYLAENVFWVPEVARWSHIKQNARSENIGKIIDDAMEAIEAEAKAFSERLEAAVARYHANAITSLEMIQELIDMAKDLKASVQRGDDLGLGDEELAFYDALSQNQSAVDVLGNEELRKIAHVLVEQLQKNVTVDWHLKERARAKLRILVRRILRKYGYPPDFAPVAVNTVLSQAETLLRWN